MHTNSYQDSIGTLSVLERCDAEECRASEATWLSVTWRSMQSWPVPVRAKARANAFWRLSENELPAQQISAEPRLITLTKRYIADHYSKSLSLEHVADAFCTDVFPLGQLVKQTTGMDFSDYLGFVRIEKAKNLLLNPHYYFAEIASEVGFESIGDFNQTFKRMVGEPPSTYRARLQARSCRVN